MRSYRFRRHYAATYENYNHSKLVQILLNAGADVNAKTAQNRTALTLLTAGTHVDITDIWGNNALTYQMNGNRRIDRHTKDEFITVLVVADEIPDSATLVKILLEHSNLQCMENELDLCLMTLCSLRIRKYLLQLDRHTNLFIRIPKLGLPSAITKFLLYNM